MKAQFEAAANLRRDVFGCDVCKNPEQSVSAMVCELVREVP